MLKRERELAKMKQIIDKRTQAAHYREEYGVCVNDKEVESLNEK